MQRHAVFQHGAGGVRQLQPGQQHVLRFALDAAGVVEFVERGSQLHQIAVDEAGVVVPGGQTALTAGYWASCLMRAFSSSAVRTDRSSLRRGGNGISLRRQRASPACRYGRGHTGHSRPGSRCPPGRPGPGRTPSACSGLAVEEDQRQASTGISSSRSVRADGLAGALGHTDGLAVAAPASPAASARCPTGAEPSRPRASRAPFSRATWPWWSAPQMLITLSKPRTANLLR